jgi:hypothetical protein
MGPKAKGWEQHMMKQAIKLNDSIELCHSQITNSGREMVGLKIVDVETGAWDLFDLDRGQVSRTAERLSDWLEQSATTCDLTNPAPIEATRIRVSLR